MFHTDLNLEISLLIWLQHSVTTQLNTIKPFFFLLGVPFSRLCLTVSFAKLLFHWPASVAKIFIMLSPSMLFCLHHTLCSLILWVWLWCVCVSVCASKVCRLRQLECLYLQGTLWWAISGLLFPQCLSVENISMHQCFPCFFTLHICNPESPFAPKAFFLKSFSTLLSVVPSCKWVISGCLI